MKHRNRLNKLQRPGWLKHGSVLVCYGDAWFIKNRVIIQVDKRILIQSDIRQVVDEMKNRKI